MRFHSPDASKPLLPLVYVYEPEFILTGCASESRDSGSQHSAALVLVEAWRHKGAASVV